MNCLNCNKFYQGCCVEMIGIGSFFSKPVEDPNKKCDNWEEKHDTWDNL